jgi:enoyl-CoA hydratase
VTSATSSSKVEATALPNSSSTTRRSTRWTAKGWFGLAGKIRRGSAPTTVRVIVIRAEGRGFCAGVDIKELRRHPELHRRGQCRQLRHLPAVHRNPVPVIAAVHGFVLGGGIGITGAADIVLASDCATFAVPEVDRGAMGGGAHLQRLFPVQKVRRCSSPARRSAPARPTVTAHRARGAARAEVRDAALESRARSRPRARP